MQRRWMYIGGTNWRMHRKTEINPCRWVCRLARLAPACLRASMVLGVLTLGVPAFAQEWPYFVTYSHDMEEPGNLEIAAKSAVGKPPAGNRFMGASLELEYGVKAVSATSWIATTFPGRRRSGKWSSS